MKHDPRPETLPLPAVRCLSKEQAAEYLGIRLTLLAALGVPALKLGRRCVYDVLDLDAWLDDYKHRERGRAGKEKSLWPVKPESIGGLIQGSGGLPQPSRTADGYAEVLGLKDGKKLKRFSPS